MKHIHDMRARMQPLVPAPAASTGHSGPRLDLSHLAALPLRHAADCDLLGAGTDGTLYVEEIIDDGDRVVQHIIGSDGDIRASVDDAAPGVFEPLALPPDAVRTQSPRQATALNFSGPRLRGSCHDDRIQELVQPLTMPDRMALVERLKFDVLPPHVLGLAESYVLAEAALTASLFVVCRRLRVAYRLDEPRHERDGTPYDYDTITIYAAHLYDRDAGTPVSVDGQPFDGVSAALDGLPGPALRRPMACLTLPGGRLAIADGGDGDRVSTVHVYEWRIQPAADG